MSDLRRTLPRLFSMLLVSTVVAMTAVPAASAAPAAKRQRSLGALHVSAAWRYSRGTGVTVAVLDTGVDGRQPDLTGQVISGPDYTGGQRRPGTRYWGRHGTAMASLIAGHGHGQGAGISGVAPEAKILSLRVTWEPNDPVRNRHLSGAHAALAQAIRYAADHGAQVISMSVGGGTAFATANRLESAAIRYALAKGAVLIAPAGNDGAGANLRTFPAAYPGVIAVGAVDHADRPAHFTNRHPYVSVAAPGAQVIDADVSGQGYKLGSGTSVSAALVAGISALIKARYPQLTPAEVKQALEQGTTHRPPNGRSIATGTGVADAFGGLHAAALINHARHAAPTASPTPTAAPAPAGGGLGMRRIAALGGGAALILAGLILAWRGQRRRGRRRRRRARQARRSLPAGPLAESPWQPRKSPPLDESPWRPRPEEQSAPAEPTWQFHQDADPLGEPARQPHHDQPPRNEPARHPQPGEPPWQPHHDRPQHDRPPPGEMPRHLQPPPGEMPWQPPHGRPAPGEPARQPRHDAFPPGEPRHDGPAPGEPARRPRNDGLPPSETGTPRGESSWWFRPEPKSPEDSQWRPPQEQPPVPHRGNGNGEVPPTPREQREVEDLDPLSEEDWQRIHEGFDKIKEDTRNWDRGWADDHPKAGDETVNLPVVQPEDEGDSG